MHEWFLKNSFDAGALPASAFVDSSCEPPLSEATLYRWLITLQYAHAQRPPHQRLRSSRLHGKERISIMSYVYKPSAPVADRLTKTPSQATDLNTCSLIE